MVDIFSGDPKLYLTEDGADIYTHDGNNQPIMETGKANVALISLFTGEGWCGNVFIRKQQNKIGSGYVAALRNPITLKSLAVIRDAAEKALLNAGFLVTDVEVSNPQSHRVDVVAKVRDATGEQVSLIMVYGRNVDAGVTWRGLEVTWQGGDVTW